MKLKNLYQGVTGITLLKPLPLFFERAAAKKRTKKTPRRKSSVRPGVNKSCHR
jgi:hypothetical protein